jgi:hypothetical protein
MRLIAIISIYFLLPISVFGQIDGVAGPDKIVSLTKGTKIGNPSDSTKCYYWEATPLDPTLVSPGAAQPDVHPNQTTTYKLTVTTNDFISITDEVTVYKLAVEYFRQAQTGKDWKVVVGDNIDYKATAPDNCTDWQWKLKGVQIEFWHLAGGNAASGSDLIIPYTDLIQAKNSDFGSTHGLIEVSCKDVDGNTYTSSSDNLGDFHAKVFFDPERNIEGGPGSTAKPPCWFVFWREGAVPGLEEFEFRFIPPEPGEEKFGKSEVYLDIFITLYSFIVFQDAGRTHYSGGLKIGNIEFGGAKGIDCCAEVVEHEKEHVRLSEEVKLPFVNDNEPPIDSTDKVGDGLADFREETYGCSISSKDTYGIASIKCSIGNIECSNAYKKSGDQEYAALIAGLGKKGVPSLDWSKNGKQW